MLLLSLCSSSFDPLLLQYSLLQVEEKNGVPQLDVLQRVALHDLKFFGVLEGEEELECLLVIEDLVVKEVHEDEEGRVLVVHAEVSDKLVHPLPLILVSHLDEKVARGGVHFVLPLLE